MNNNCTTVNQLQVKQANGSLIAQFQIEFQRQSGAI
jgi:hypothetical protein